MKIKQVRTAPLPIVFTLSSGTLLVVAAGARYDVIPRLPYPEEGDAIAALESLRIQERALLASINRMRALHGQNPIT